jgi:hypothetical protein
LYRDLKLRGAIIKDKDLIILPEEKLFNKIAGCFKWLYDALWRIAKDCFVKPCCETLILFVRACTRHSRARHCEHAFDA